MASTRSDDDILQEIRERYTYATDAWRTIREQGAKDMRYVAGDAWEPQDREIREKAGRPCLSLDELGQYVNQLINDVRQHKRGIKVSPIGDGATDETAELRQALIREIEYRSNAQQAYTAMFESTVQRSYGFVRIKPKYVNERSFDQELVIEPIVDPDAVTMDPDGLRPDGSDARYAFVRESFDVKRFRREFPTAQHLDFEDMATQAPDWCKGERIQVAEYWAIETKRRRLLLIQPPLPAQPLMMGQPVPPMPAMTPVALFDDEPEAVALLAAGGTVLTERMADVPYVCQYLTNGIELLAKKGEPKKTEWPGTSIPIVSCLGKVLYVDFGAGVERRILSLVRLARDPAMLYAYYRTCQAELVGMTPKTPFIGYVESFRGHEDQWAKINHEPMAYLTVNSRDDATGGDVLPLPQRQPYDPPIQALELGAESARRAIQAAMGISPLPTSAQRQNQKSGIALQKIEDSTQRGSYHFVDHYEAAITRVGAILDELIPHYYDAAREVTIREGDDEPSQVRINDPQADTPRDVTVGQHDVTISVGPAFASQRQAAEDFADSLAQSPIFPQIADLVVKLKNLGPIGDEIAQRLTPPEYRTQQDGPPDPTQVAQMQQQMQQMQQALQQAQQAIETEQAKQQATIERERIKAESAVKIAEIEAAASMQRTVIEVQARGMASERDAATKILQTGEEAREAERDRQHETAIEAMKQANQAVSRASELQSSGPFV